MRTLKYATLAALACSGLTIILRMIVGPIVTPAQVRTPLNAEGWFGLALTVLLVLNGQSESRPRASPVKLIPCCLLIAFTAIALRPALDLYFLGDDFYLVQLAHSLPGNPIPLFTTAGGDGFLRPIGYVSLIWTKWAGIDPFPWHVAALLLHLGNVILVFALASRLGASQSAACFSAALFAIHGTRPEAVGWIGGRFDLLATFFLLTGLLLFLASFRIAPVLCLILAILSKETAYVFPILLVFLLVAERKKLRECSALLLPYFATSLALFLYRCWLFGGIGGYRDPETGQPQALMFGPSTLKALALRIWTGLYFPINWSTEPSWLLAALVVAYVLALTMLLTSSHDRRRIAVAAGFILASVLPPLHLLAIGPELSNSRLLYLPSLGFALMLGFAIDGLAAIRRWTIAGVILAFQFAALQHNLSQWDYVSNRSRIASAVLAQCDLPRGVPITAFGEPATLRGVPYFVNVYPDAIRFLRRAHPVEGQGSCPQSFDALRLR